MRLLGPSSSGGESSRTGSPVESNLYLVPDAAIGLLPTTPPIDSATTTPSEPTPKAAEAVMESSEEDEEATAKIRVEGQRRAAIEQSSFDDGDASDAETVVKDDE
mmetsp:Transcript_28660/g.23729  ORF Transcript_28660/g.23729 Transcript_28660/m.23729 type:complete len:105 (-) Transcript_28660:29-343(-)